MQISFSQRGSGTHAVHYPNSVLNSPSVSAKQEKQEKRDKEDRITISAQSMQAFKQDQNRVLEQIMKRKENLIERRSTYLSNALESGTSAEVIKAELEDIDTQIQEVEGQMRAIQMEQQHKALEADKESEEEHKTDSQTDKSESNANESMEKGLVSTETMKSVVSASSGMKHVASVKTAQTTLYRESKGWEYSDPAKSSALKSKAEALDGKIFQIASDIHTDITKATEKEIDSNNDKRKDNLTSTDRSELDRTLQPDELSEAEQGEE